jgi:putative transposase
MARIARLVIPGIPHHITQRGNRRQEVFFSDKDYEAYLELLAEHCQANAVEIWAYCLMPNHVHLIAIPETEGSLARGIGEAHRRYTRMINFREGWRGYLWQGRFASYPLDSAHLLMAARYIEQNPVRARLRRLPWRYPWSSAAEHIVGKSKGLVSVEPLLEMVSDWKEFVSGGLEEEELEVIRRHSRTGRPLVEEKFIEHLESQLGRVLRPLKRGPKGPWKHKRDKK